ncbi:pentatricopeptide repeat-containing protein At1g55890, mitochondrial isoform X2 [Vigna radiata var. radiata]|uniref:Pentatricopeptide repeat-containing protein At1g55890, mitochondrial isoform X2 n=1 Tax=Vigna radiata var. radiata TaxID=3916 RepID=A0A1S3UP23_VIGRR|nr:pentatricopeptide repeat-containing protein At1g55890, mitochondrial isoform X2 [Vigna radiata var. radiata]
MAALSRLVNEPAKVSIKSISEDLYKEVKLKRLVEKFKKASDIDQFRKKTGIYEVTVRRLAGAKRFGWVHDILEHQKQYSDISNEGFSARLIFLYGKSGMAKHARMVFDEMPQRKCNRTVLSFNALLAAYLHSRKFNVVDELFKTLPTQLSIEPDLVSYNTLIKAFCEEGSFDSALSVLKEMEEKGVNPDSIKFNTLLDGLYSKGSFEDGEKVWGLMGAKNVTPDVTSYSSKLVGLFRENKPDEVVELYREMEKVGVKLDFFYLKAVVNAVIKCCVNDGDLDEVKNCLGVIADFDLDLHKSTYSILVPFLREKCDLMTTIKLCKEIMEKRGRVDGSLLQLVVDKLVNEGKISKAKEIVEAWKTYEDCRYRLNLP